MSPDFGKMAGMLERVRRLSIALTCYIQNNPVIVDQNTANIRAKLCASCHNNVEEAKALARCVLGRDQERKAMAKMMECVNGKITPHDSQLKHCDIDGSDNRLSTWLFNVFLLDRNDINRFPCYCWKKELQH